MRGVVGAVALVLSVAACGDGGDGGSSPAPSYDFGAFAAEIDAFVDEKAPIDGVGAIVVHRDHGVIFQQSFGAFADDRAYLLASTSKMLTAGVLMRLHDDGLLDVDAPVADVVPWGAGNPTITPAQLISNSSGLVGLRPEPSYGPYLCQFVHQGTLQQCAERIFTTTADDDRVVPPDTTYRYGGAQWQVAGAVAEAASGKSWHELIREIYVEPCALETFGYNNHFVQFPGSQGTYPAGFDGDPANLLPTDNPNMEGGAYATTGDYGKLLLMHLRGGTCGDSRVLSEASVRRMREDRVIAYGGETGTGFEGYGFGWWIDRDRPYLAIDPGAYGAYAWIDESRGYGVFFGIESNTGLGAELFARLLPLAEEAVDGGE